ncbi:MAG: hypothetical protein KDB27_13300 [Planctomycetales bacterium]|nr:hypothetical protein [Planctomycetales bacterium]
MNPDMHRTFSPDRQNSFVICIIAGIVATCFSLNAAAQEFFHHDRFLNGELQGNWGRQLGNGNIDSTPGEFVLHDPNDVSAWWLTRIDGERVDRRSEWSFRARVTLDEIVGRDNVFFAVGTSLYHHAGIRETIDGDNFLRAGICNGDVCETPNIEVPYSYLGEEVLVQYDGFGDEIIGTVWKDGNSDSQVQVEHFFPLSDTFPAIALANGSATIHELWISSEPIPISFLSGDFDGNGNLDAADIDALLGAADGQDTRFDVTGDDVVDMTDHRTWVKDRKNTWYGDANLDGEFNSSDLVAVFQAGHYEDGIAMNSGWANGDWNGDGYFDSGDLVVAFQDGGFELGQRTRRTVAVPEPMNSVRLVVILGLVALKRRRLTRTLDVGCQSCARACRA